MDDNMTIAEMIDTYANFTNTREYYNLYKEAVSLDLKSLYVLTESYMQESSIESILEGSGIWDSIVEGAVKFWEWIKKIFRKLINHISRFFHKIFSFTDQWYKAERAYIAGVNKARSAAMSIAGRARSGDRAEDMVSKAAYAVAKDLGFYKEKYVNGIEQNMDGDKISKEIFEALGDLASGKKPAANKFSSNDVTKMNRGTSGYETMVASGPLNKFSTDPGIKSLPERMNDNELLPQFYHTTGNPTIEKFFQGLAYYAAGRNVGVGVFIPGKQADPLCKILRADRDIRDGKTFADLLNITYLLTKPPLTVQVHEMFPTLLKLVEDFNNIVPKYIEGNGINTSIISKWSEKVTKATASEKNSYTDIVVDQRFDTKLERISGEFNVNLSKIKTMTNLGETSGKIDISNTDAGIKYEIDDRDREKALGGMSSSEGLKRIGSKDDIDALTKGAKTEFVKASASITKMFSDVALGVMMITKGMKTTLDFRTAYIDAVVGVIAKS